MSALLLTSCVSTRHREETVITDYGTHVLRSEGAGVREELAVLLQHLRDEGDENNSEAQHRIPRELLFVEDAVKEPLRELAAQLSGDAQAAQYILWFLGDKSDVRAMQPKIKGIGKPLVAAGVTRADLAESLRAIRETLKLPDEHFRTQALVFNRRMTKAYVQIVTGPGAFNCEGWGLMFHLNDAGWELIWSRFEWIS